jgi:tetratricopeptide (TPR) repeat protein
MNSRRARLGILLVVFTAGFAGISLLQKRIDRQLAAVHQERDDLMIRSGRFLKVLSLDYGPFLADVYWTRVVQYYGDKRVRHDENLELLPPLLDLTTTLDPQLLVAYRFGAIFLAEPAPRGAGRPDLAEALIRRGIENNPDYWRFWQDLGMLYYWDVRDYKKAAEAFLEGSRKPGAYEWMKVMAAKIAEEGQSRATSVFLWRQIYESTKDPAIRKNALNHLKTLAVEDDREHLDEVLSQFVQRFNRLPRSLGELVSAGLLRRVPMDPEGYPYVLGPTGTTELHPKSPLRSGQSGSAPPS